MYMKVECERNAVAAIDVVVVAACWVAAVTVVTVITVVTVVAIAALSIALFLDLLRGADFYYL